MRLGFAALVLLSHAFPLGGFNGGADWMWSWTKGQEDFGGFAVAGFFVVSGFLVTRSFVSSSTSVSYLWKRVLRIFPGFWVCLLVTVILFGPLAYFHQYGHLSGYINGPFLDTPEKYLQNNYLLSMNQYSVDSLLGSNPYPHAFDGSLWTLVNEFKCYLAVFALGIVGILRRARFVTLGIVAFLWAIEIVQFRNPSWVSPKVPFFGDLQLVHLAFMFSLGAALFLFRDRIPVSNLFALVAVGIYAVGCRYGLYPGISEVAFAYLCLWVAVRLPISEHRQVRRLLVRALRVRVPGGADRFDAPSQHPRFGPLRHPHVPRQHGLRRSQLAPRREAIPPFEAATNARLHVPARLVDGQGSGTAIDTEDVW